MAILDSIAIEIQAMVAGVLILLIVTLLEIIDLQRGKKQHRQELQAIANGRVPTQKERLVSPFSLILGFIFGLAAFALFGYGMMYLIIIGMPVLAAVAGVSAFIGVIVPFVIWSACRKAKKETAEALQDLERRRHEAASRKQPPQTPAAPAVAAPAVEQTPVIADKPAVKEPTPVAKPETKPALYPKPDPSHVIPQDSMLRRHFLTHLAAAAKPYQPTRPTDSMLRRHYDAMLASRIDTPRVEAVAAKITAPAAATPARQCTHKKVNVPEDSMLRRHFLTTLRIKIESHLSLPARPTDSMLRRHFDTWKAELITTKLNKYLEG